MKTWNERGESIISVLVSAAIVGILVMTIISLYQMYSSMSVKSTGSREAELLANRVRGIVGHRGFCVDALGGQVWNGTTATDVVIQNKMNPSKPIAYSGMDLTGTNGALRLQRIYLRVPDHNKNLNWTDDPNPGHPVVIGTQTYTSYFGELVMNFGSGSNASKDTISLQRVAPIVLTVNSSGAIINCDPNDESSEISTCDSAKAALGAHPCPSPVPSNCSAIFYVYGISYGNPLCGCSLSCTGPVWRVAGLYRCFKAGFKSNPKCPAGVTTTSSTVSCKGKEGSICYLAQKRSAGSSCFATMTWEEYRFVCK